MMTVGRAQRVSGAPAGRSSEWSGTGGVRRSVARFLAAALLVFVSTGLALAQERQEKRVALLVGNSIYQNYNKLDNPFSDAAAVAAVLDRMAFQVDVGQNLSLKQFRAKLEVFASAIRGADIALLFYAGHGIQYEGHNYLLPVDIELKTKADVAAKTIKLDDVLAEMGKQAKASVTFLDACRDAPKLLAVTRDTPKESKGLLASLLNGLAPLSEAAVHNHFVGYAAASGKTALDGRSRNSPFTTALINRIATPDVGIGDMFTYVRGDVLKATGNRQAPESLSRLAQPLYLNPKLAFHAPGESDSAPQLKLSPETEFWREIKDSTDASDFAEYLEAYPKGLYIHLARRKLEELKSPKAGGQRPAPSDKPPQEGDVVAVTATASITRDHPKVEAQRSARALARAKAILAVLTKVPSGNTGLPDSVPSSGAAAELLSYMSRGISYEEDWKPPQSTSRQVRVELRAKVRLLQPENERRLNGLIEPVEVISGKGARSRPESDRTSSAQADPTEIISGKAFRFRIDAKKEASIGVYVWQADGTMVRLYPESASNPVRIKAGESVWFPRDGDSHTHAGIAAQNMPGEKRNHEALIVVAGSTSLPFEKLVPTVVAQTAQHSSAHLVDATAFLGKLAAIGDPGLELLVLPYEVRGD